MRDPARDSCSAGPDQQGGFLLAGTGSPAVPRADQPPPELLGFYRMWCVCGRAKLSQGHVGVGLGESAAGKLKAQAYPQLGCLERARNGSSRVRMPVLLARFSDDPGSPLR